MSEAASTNGSHGRSRRTRVLALLIIVAIVVASGLVLLYARGGGPLPAWLGGTQADLLDASGPEEAALRTLRLAGYDHAAAGFEDGVAVLRVEVPYVRTSADVELSWQTALGVGAAAWPGADRYVAQVFAEGTALVEVAIAGDDLREVMDAATDGSEPAAVELERRADVRLLSDGGLDG